MAKRLQRFWFDFEMDDSDYGSLLLPGCGVTGYSEEDCLTMIRQQLLDGNELPPIRRVIPDIDVSTLDEGHVLPGIGIPVWRGIWFPRRNL